MSKTRNKIVNSIEKIARFRIEEHNLINKVIVVIGPRETGKSFLMRDILYQIREIPVGKVISGTEEAKPFYKFFIPDMFIDSKWSDEKAESVLERGMEITEKNQARKKAGKRKLDNRTFFVMDDCMGREKKKWANSPVVDEIFKNGRHYGLTVIIASQNALGIPSDLRDQVDYTFVTGVRGGTKFRDNLYEHYAKGFADKKEFGKVLDACTQNYNVLVIKNCDTTNEFENSVFWYNAKEHPGFRMCDSRVWELHGRKFDKHYKIKEKQRKEREKIEKERFQKTIQKKKTKEIVKDNDIVLMK